jgi:predicted O-methyltransferase YrrM
MRDPILTETADWSHVGERTALISRASVLRTCVELSKEVPGNIIEFGVADGGSTRVIARTARGSGKKIFACDSFEGLPEAYENAAVGTFACDPPRIAGVEIVKGYFEDSLTDDLAKRVGRVAFASLDADLYSSTKCALHWLTPLLGSGSLLLFDEFLGENGAEKRAFEEWARECGVSVIRIGYFLREPSGWGSKIDARALYQVVANEPLARITKSSFKARAAKTLKGHPALYGLARKLYRKIR